MLDRLRRDRDIARPAPTARLRLDGSAPVHGREFAPGSQTQDVRFGAPATGRQFCIEALDAADGKPYAAIAEPALLDSDGKTLDQPTWTMAWVDSDETDKDDGGAPNAINGQNGDCWITAGQDGGYPHCLVILRGPRAGDRTIKETR